MQEKSEKNAEISARIKTIIENENINRNVFARKLGYERSQTIYDILNAKSAPSHDFYERFINTEYSEVYNVSWIISGKGEMLKSKKNNEYTYTDSPVIADELAVFGGKKILSSGKAIPLYDIRTNIGLKSIFANVQHNFIDTIIIPNMTNADGAMYVIGDSMAPSLKAGDIVIFKKINNTKYLIPGDIYVLSYEIDGDEYCVIKRVNEAPKRGFLQLTSEDREHNPIVIPAKSINAIALIKASIRSYSMG
ncbi:MAG: S24/S26 family peptidase [Tannerella sp.]|jgi:phage repressor protein C with HTH and peptisase S24 domain|nr:S24/S26 family peptidase [Tannerella sp.]